MNHCNVTYSGPPTTLYLVFLLFAIRTMGNVEKIITENEDNDNMKVRELVMCENEMKCFEKNDNRTCESEKKILRQYILWKYEV